VRAIDLTRQDGFLADIHEDEGVGIGQNPDRPVETAEREIGLGQEPPEPPLDPKGRGGRQEGAVSGGLTHITPRSPAVIIVSLIHVGKRAPC